MAAPPPREPAGPPNESAGALFMRFLRFGTLAWGGPVAQIAMLRDELVERERWISRERFNRVLAVYQVLPGPEAHELCVYFGMLARGRAGAILAGLGFMLPGLVLMLLLSWGYVSFGLTSPSWRAAMLGCQGAVAALIVRAVVRIGTHALTSPLLGVLALAAAIGQFAGANPIPLLAAAGVVHALWRRVARGSFGEAPGSGEGEPRT
ncbi:MAG TPA: chromate transporter, partial [Gemmatimonadaceae bacterium]|nr:chromate transporter [Gemmatimonadaceae bacterium]